MVVDIILMRYLHFIAAFTLWTGTASAQGPCSSAEGFFKVLFEKYNERIVFSGEGPKDRTYYTTLSKSGSWTKFFTFYTKEGDQIACIISAGRNGVAQALPADPGEPI
jgi:hypothetical protein